MILIKVCFEAVTQKDVVSVQSFIHFTQIGGEIAKQDRIDINLDLFLTRNL